MLVDIGGGKTNVAIYHHGAVRHTVVVPIGGEHFTNDIAVGLRTTIPEAERLKREQGCAISSMADQDNVFEIVGMGSRQPRAIAQQVLERHPSAARRRNHSFRAQRNSKRRATNGRPAPASC